MIVDVGDGEAERRKTWLVLLLVLARAVERRQPGFQGEQPKCLLIAEQRDEIAFGQLTLLSTTKRSRVAADSALRARCSVDLFVKGKRGICSVCV